MKDNIILERIQNFLYSFYAKDIKDARLSEIYDGLVNSLMQDIGRNWSNSKKINSDYNTYILSFEYNPGKFLEKTIKYLNFNDEVNKTLSKIDISLQELIDYEKEANLGSGDIGIGSWYLIREFSRNNIKAIAYALRYESGSMKQIIREGKQEVNPNEWLYTGNKWEHKKSFSYMLNIDNRNLKSVAYDMPVVNEKNDFVNTIRMWKPESINKINYYNLHYGDINSVYNDYVSDNVLTQFMYLDNSSDDGKFYRLKQEYFYCVSSIQDIFRRFFKENKDIRKISYKVNIILSDIHPSLALIEFIRTLYKGYNIELKEAIDISKKVFTHIAFLLTPESREYYDLSFIKKLDENFYDFVNELDEFSRKYFDLGIIYDNQLVYENINILFTGDFYYLSKQLEKNKKREFNNISYLNFGIDKDMYSYENNIYFNDVLNKYDIKSIDKIKILKDNDDFLKDLDKAKLLNKQKLIETLQLNKTDFINPYSIFDMQLSGFHEAKRQLLNVLSIAAIYYKLKLNSNILFSPTTYIFSGIANDGYFMAKEVIKFILALKKIIDNDKLIKNKLKIIFVEDLNVEKSKILFPACDIYSNLTNTLYDNQSFDMFISAFNFSNIVSSKAGVLDNIKLENSIYKFGDSYIENLDTKKKSYNANEYYYNNDIIKSTIDNLINEKYSNLSYDFKTIFNYLIEYNDSFHVLKDIEELVDLRFKMGNDYINDKLWIKNSIDNLLWADGFNLDSFINKFRK